jgi:lipoate-protein ligase A
MSTVCRLLPEINESGPFQMAADEALLNSAVQQRMASLRFYTWNVPTLSLGYFQPHTEHFANVAWLRRQTGGAAILHHLEWTYALALPSGAPWHDSESWICRFHHVIQRALREFGVVSHAVVCGEEQKLGPVLCFLHQTPGDVLMNGHKVVGSAQRRPHGAMLQHGSILLQQSPHTPNLPGIENLSGKSIKMGDLKNTILAEFKKEIQQPLEESDWTEAERTLTETLKRDKYGAAEWNEKR